MAWEEELFAVLDELEQQADSLYAAERDAELADRSRAEYQQVTLASRLMASVGRSVRAEVRGAGLVSGRLDRVADGWCVLSGRGQDWVVRIAAIAAVRGASERAVPEIGWSPVTRLGLGSALRRLAEADVRCVVHRLDGVRVEGRIGRVGADFAELYPEVETIGGPDPGTVLIAFGSLAAVQSRG